MSAICNWRVGKMKKNKLKELVESVGLSYKKEMSKIIIINAVMLIGYVLIYIFLRNIIYTILLVILTAVIDYFLLTRYNDIKKTILKNHENELIALLSYFEVYLKNNSNVYQSFVQLIPYSSDWMKDKIEQLLREIDEDKTVQPFVNFALNFQMLSVHSLMLSIYQMVDQGENSEQLNNFTLIFDELSHNRNKEMIEQKEKSLSNMSTFPLIGAGLITITLTISVLSILGDLINVI